MSFYAQYCAGVAIVSSVFHLCSVLWLPLLTLDPSCCTSDVSCHFIPSSVSFLHYIPSFSSTSLCLSITLWVSHSISLNIHLFITTLFSLSLPLFPVSFSLSPPLFFSASLPCGHMTRLRPCHPLSLSLSLVLVHVRGASLLLVSCLSPATLGSWPLQPLALLQFRTLSKRANMCFFVVAAGQ